MSLIEGEIIEDVDQVDESWWTGSGPGGKAGLFPGSCYPHSPLVGDTHAHDCIA